MNEQREQADQDEFVRRFVASQHEIWRYIVALVPQVSDAHEVLQETSIALWRKYSEYDPAEPFVPWACRFAWYEVLRHRRDRRRQARQLGDATLQLLVDGRSQLQHRLDHRRSALADCLRRLSPADRQLLREHYHDRVSIAHIASRTRRSVHTLYKAVQQIRQRLMRCIDRAMEA
jgi:RNA polymerase sigma-70 factor (ECF subfamily)